MCVQQRASYFMEPPAHDYELVTLLYNLCCRRPWTFTFSWQSSAASPSMLFLLHDLSRSFEGLWQTRDFYEMIYKQVAGTLTLFFEVAMISARLGLVPTLSTSDAL
jgi:hypothetical protein